MNKILQVKDLSKTYKTGKKALSNLTFSVEEGEILGFLGPNGAGKSTTINIIATLLKADSGSITYFDDPSLKSKEIKRKMGIVPQEIALYEDISAYENVNFFAALYGIPKKERAQKVNNALAKVGLLDRKNDKPATFSGGMKRRLNIACALAHEPKLIIFDEPTVGIDPQSRNHILKSIKALQKSGTTIIYTTHYMEEVQQICDRIIIMDGGKVLLNNGLEDILSKFNGINYQLTLDKSVPESTVWAINQLKGVSQASLQKENILNLQLTDISYLIPALTLLGKAKLSLIDISKKEHSLEDVFLSLTSQELRD